MGLWFETYKITKPIRLIELFAGIGAQAKALENLGVKFEHWKICEFDKYPVCSYNAIHHTNFLPSDITKIHAEDLEIENIDKYEYIMTYSFPCITSDSLIYTKEKGYIEFKDLKVGDEVLTKSNTFHKIVKIFDNGVHQTCYLDGMGFENIHCTLNHKFYTREMYRRGHKSIRTFREPIFKEVKDLTKKDYFGVPVNKIEENFYTNELWFWYLMGFYLGDGWIDKYNKRICLAANEKKLERLSHNVFNHIKYSVYKDKTCYKITVHNKEIYSFIKDYMGTGCETKFVSPKIINLPKNELMAFYDGYLNSDGSIVKGKHQFSSINRNIIYSISMIINKLYLRPTSIYKIKVSPTKKIEDRIVNQKEWYQLRFNPLTNIQDKAFYEDGYIWYPFNKYIIDKEEHVYNMEVEDDHSYIIQGCVSKNCQDLSLAGNRKGMSRESGTRSGLLWEVERLLKECNEKGNLPQILLMENVPQVIGEGNKKDFDEWYNFLASLGYSSKYKILNSKDFGIPQNRQRCYMVSILGDYEYEFPSGFPLKLTLRDLLEKNVDEKYYLSEKMIESFTYNSQKQKEKGNGFKFEPTNGEGVAKTITTLAGNRMDDNFLFGNENLNETLEKNKDKLGNDVLSIDAYNKSVHKDISQTITTRVSDSNQHFLYEGVCIDDKFPGSREPRYYKDEAPTIDTHTQLKVVEKSIPIKENTKKGYKEAHDGDGVYINRVDVKRGTVQKDMIQTITTAPNDIGVVVKDERFKESALKTFNDNECKEGDTIDAYNQRVNDTGISPTITTRPEGFKTAILPVVKEEYLGTYNYNDSDKFIGDRNREKIRNEISSTVLAHHQDGVIVGSTQKHADVREDGISPSLTSAMGMGGGQVPMHNYDLRIRKLTPKECWRLMGFEDIDFDNAKKALNDTFYNGEDRSNSQLYKQAGNSIVVQVLMALFKQLL